MPARSAIEQLPEEIKKELEQRLIRGGFAGYQALAEWLQSKGFEISKSAVHRYGKGFEERLKALKVATDQAKAIASASEDDAGLMNDALIRLVQTKTFELLVELEMDDKSLPKIGRMVAELARAAVGQKKWMQEVSKKAKKAADEVQAISKANGLSDEAASEIYKKILGVTA